MGLSAPMASAIVLAGIVIFIGSVSSSMLYGLYYFTDLVAYDRIRVKSRLELTILSVTNSSVEISVTNLGPRTVFFVSEGGYRWSSIIISYRSGSAWETYLIDDYEVVEINVTDTNFSFNPSTHQFISPGETARIRAYLPAGAPEIEIGSPVTVVFSSRFGEVAEGERIREV